MLNIEYPAQRLEDGLSLPRTPFIAVVQDFLSGVECADLVQRIEAIGPGAAPITMAGGRQVNMPEIRNNDRVMFEDDTRPGSASGRITTAPTCATSTSAARSPCCST